MKTLRHLCFLLLLGVVLSGCTIGTEPPPSTPIAMPSRTTTARPTLAAHSLTLTPIMATAERTTAPRATASPTKPTATRTPAPTLTQAPTPTVQATLTAKPTATVPPAETNRPRIKIDQPMEGMFLQSTVEVSGTVDMAEGQVRANIFTPDGKPLGIKPVVLATEPNGDHLSFHGTIPLGYAPTPRGIVVVVEYLNRDGDVVASTQQRANIEGRFARLQYLTVEHPQPYSVLTDPTIPVYGAAPGPPATIEVRLLDSGGNVLTSAQATFGWYRQGLPCDFSATIDNRPEGTEIEVVSMDTDGKLLERVKVPLEARQ